MQDQDGQNINKSTVKWTRIGQMLEHKTRDLEVRVAVQVRIFLLTSKFIMSFVIEAQACL